MRKLRLRPLALAALLALSFLAAGSAGQAQARKEVFRNLSPKESAALGRGEAVIRPLADPGRMSLGLQDEAVAGIRARVKAVRPNYLTEFLLTVPVKDDAAAALLFRRLAAALADVEGFVKIPYWSKQQKTTYDLYDLVKVENRTPMEGGEAIEVLQHMEPFDAYRARYEYRRKADSLRFSCVNLETIVYSYKRFPAVPPGDMAWELYAFRNGDHVDVYGIGAVRASDLFGILRDRLEPSFMGRVEAFFTFLSKKLSL